MVVIMTLNVARRPLLGGNMEDKERKIVKRALFNYPKLLDGVVQSTVDWAESNIAVDYSKVAVQTSPSNHKETQLCKLIDKNQNNIRWCYVVEKVLDHYKFEEDKVRFIDLYYFKHKGETQACLEVGICRRTMFYWQEEILEITYRWAREFKLIGD